MKIRYVSSVRERITFQMSIIWIVPLYPLTCAAVPEVPRPSNDEFVKYAQEGKIKQMIQDLRRYPYIVDARDSVSALCCGYEDLATVTMHTSWFHQCVFLIVCYAIRLTRALIWYGTDWSSNRVWRFFRHLLHWRKRFKDIYLVSPSGCIRIHQKTLTYITLFLIWWRWSHQPVGLPYIFTPVLSQFRGLYYFSNLQSKLTRDWLRINGNPRSVRCETCTQSYIMPYRRHSNSANTKLGCHNVARPRNHVCQSKRIPFAHPNALPRLSTERLRTNLFRIFDHTESHIPPQMTQMNKTLRPLGVATTMDPHLIITILCWNGHVSTNGSFHCYCR